MRRFLTYSARRLAFVPIQLFVISLIVFFLVRLLPGDPSYLFAGPYATQERIEVVRQSLGLDQPIYTQYLSYLANIFRGDLGDSWLTSQKVTADIAQRLPATFELVTLAVIVSVLVGVPLGIYTAIRTRGIADRAVWVYGMMAGSLPDFWFGLIGIYVFFFLLGWLPGPIGRLDLAVSAPASITGMYSVDALLTRDWPSFRSALAHLFLPVMTLVFIYMPLVLKNTRTATEEILNSEFLTYARALGLPRHVQLRYVLRNVMAPVITVIGIMYWFLLGGAVLVETVFSWGGMGQYAVQAVTNSDYAALQAVVLISALFTIVVFLVVDIAYFLVDPRIK